jgi:DNA end-binding protein Ku
MRAIWKGALSFGLINIPINLYSATRERELKFRMLHKTDLSEIRYVRVCAAEGVEVPYKDIVKGYEESPGQFVTLTEEDFQKANLEKTKTIEIVAFAGEEEIDTIFYEKPYLLEPDKRAGKAYVLLRDALKKSGKVAIVKYVFKNHEVWV